MKLLKLLLPVAIVAAMAMPAQAQFRFGIKAGVNINSLKFNNEIFNAGNRAGFTVGAMAEFTVPLIGVGGDIGVMFVRRNSQYMNTLGEKMDDNRSYFEIPLNFKYKLSLPAISSIISPFITTGPSFAFLTTKKEITDFVKNKTCDIAWNFGFGVELIKHIQIAASYGLGLTKAVEYVAPGYEGVDLGKNRYWTVTAAYIF